LELVERRSRSAGGRTADGELPGALAFARDTKTLAAFDRYERRALSRRNRGRGI